MPILKVEIVYYLHLLYFECVNKKNKMGFTPNCLEYEAVPVLHKGSRARALPEASYILLKI